MTTVIEWHDAQKELPKESGRCFVKTITDFWVVNYSNRYKRFNTSDDYGDECVKMTAFPTDSVLYWAELPAVPEGESEGV